MGKLEKERQEKIHDIAVPGFVDGLQAAAMSAKALAAYRKEHGDNYLPCLIQFNTIGVLNDKIKALAQKVNNMSRAMGTASETPIAKKRKAVKSPGSV